MLEIEDDVRSLTINGRLIELDQEIDSLLVLSDRVIVVLEFGDFSKDDPERGQNVIALDESGKQLWRVQHSGDTDRIVNGRRIPHGYELVWEWPKGKVNLLSVNGNVFDLNPRSGKLSNKRNFDLSELVVS